MLYFDNYYLLLVVPAIIISIIAQIRVQSTYSKYSKVFAKGTKTALTKSVPYV